MIASLFLLGSQGSANALPVDARLDRPLAIEARIEPLPDLLARLGKEIGVRLTVGREMAGLKTTVLTDARPTRRTLAALASVFDAEWTRTRGDGYRLTETSPARMRRLTYLRLNDQERRRRVESFLDPNASPSVDRTGGLRPKIVRLYRESTKNDQRRFWRGETLCRIDVTPAQEDQGLDAVSVGRSLLLVRSHPVGAGIQLRWISPTLGGSYHDTFSDVTEPESVKTSAFRLAQTAWATDPRSSAVPELDRPLVAFAPVHPVWSDERWTDSDELEMLHRATGLSIVAEAFRRMRECPSFPTGVPLRRAWRELRMGGLRLEDGTLLLRPYDFLDQREIEPDESALRAFETSPREDAAATIDAAANLYASVPVTVVPFVPDAAARRTLRFLWSGNWALRIWGGLSRSERETALTPGGLSLDRVRTKARATVKDALVGAILGGENDFVEGADRTLPVPPERSADVAATLLGLRDPVPLVLHAWQSHASPLPSRAKMLMTNINDYGLVLRIQDSAGDGLRLIVPQPDAD